MDAIEGRQSENLAKKAITAQDKSFLGLTQ